MPRNCSVIPLAKTGCRKLSDMLKLQLSSKSSEEAASLLNLNDYLIQVFTLVITLYVDSGIRSSRQVIFPKEVVIGTL